MIRRFSYLVLLAVVVVLIACSPISVPPAATPTPVSTPTPEIVTLELSQSAPLSDSGLQMDFPTGWTTRAQGPTTIIEEHDFACDLHDGYCVVSDIRSTDFMETMGLPENATTQDLLELNRGFFSWEELSEPQEGTVFGVPALGLRYADDGVWGYIWTGLFEGGAFMINVSGTSAEALDEILPTFDAMLASVKPIE